SRVTAASRICRACQQPLPTLSLIVFPTPLAPRSFFISLCLLFLVSPLEFYPSTKAQGRFFTSLVSVFLHHRLQPLQVPLHFLGLRPLVPNLLHQLLPDHLIEILARHRFRQHARVDMLFQNAPDAFRTQLPIERKKRAFHHHDGNQVAHILGLIG